jgi:hypothetical protein
LTGLVACFACSALLLAAAGKAAKQLVELVAPATRVRTIAAFRAAGDRQPDAASRDGRPDATRC